mmetsp:Transcript_35314/g.113830  ORF Transcript_35314/g.113830 Transcript_35314/m.113830 type:complete len:399 (+) Transcript_35314:85-1281(+)
MGRIEIESLWIYPVKGCRGVSVESARVSATGLELDRAFCIVDMEGVVVAAREAISKRKLPALATIETVLLNGGATLELRAPGQAPIQIETAPLNTSKNGDILIVDASGKSTTTSGGGDEDDVPAMAGWKLGELKGVVLEEASEWVNIYLNGVVKTASGKARPTRYAMVRSVSHLSMEEYPPIFPLLERASTDELYAARFKGNARLFSDFAPFLLVNRASAKDLSTLSEAAYPIHSFRGNIVVKGAAPWAEEGWASVLIEAAGGEAFELGKIKECPRCTVPCRDEATGQFLFLRDKLKLWKVLKAAFPLKFSDPEWGVWAGAFFGLYMGHNGKGTGTVLRVGDTVHVLMYRPWDVHLPAAQRLKVFWGGIQWRRRIFDVSMMALFAALGLAAASLGRML